MINNNDATALSVLYQLLDSVYFRNSILLFSHFGGKIYLVIYSFGLLCERVSHMDLPLVGLTCFLFEIIVTLQQHIIQFVCAHEDGEASFFVPFKKSATFQQHKLSFCSFPVVIYFVLTFMCEVLSCFEVRGLFTFFVLRFIFSALHSSLTVLWVYWQQWIEATTLHNVQLL